MKNIIALSTMLSGMNAGYGDSYSIKDHHWTQPTESEIEDERFRRKRKDIDNKKKKGLKVFIVEGEEIWALNEKNAIKKYNKKK